ncbi:MAG: PA14 domain-containing protein [Dehalococcoidia bacterium]|nr:PA14 domain-containing protein [Dehalococcoidia bacterium]
MNVLFARGLLALLALVFALAGQYFLEHKSALAPGLFLFLAGGIALATAHVKRPSVFLPSLLMANAQDAPPESRRNFGAGIAVPLVILLLGLSLYRSFSNPNDSLAWMLHFASIIAFIYFLAKPSSGAITEKLRGALHKPSRTTLIEGGVLLGILALAMFLRLFLLRDMPFGLWYDEGIHGMSAAKILEDSSYRPIFVPAANVASPTIFLQAVSIWIFGRNAVALRLPSVFLDFGVILLLYFLARRFLGWRIALVVALLVAVSSWDMNWARSAMPGVTAPLLALSSILAYLWALKRNTLLSYGLAGIVLGSGIWFYQAVRIMPVVVIFIVAYVYFRNRPPSCEFARKFALYIVGAILVAAPLLQYSATHPAEFWKRAGAVTAKTTGYSLDSVRFLMTNLDEYLLMFNYQGDPNGRHNLPDEPMLSFGVAALALLGFLYCLSRPHRPASFLLLVWFFFALLPGLITLPDEAPNTLRVIGTLPVAYLFAGVGVAAVGEALTPLIPRYAGILLGVPLAIGLAAIGIDSFHTYFHLQKNSLDVWNSFRPTQTAVAYRLLELPSSNYDVQLAPFIPHYPVITFLVPNGPRISTYNPARHPPSSASGDGALMFLDRPQEQYLGLIKEFYPEGSISQMDFGQGPRQDLVYTVELDRDDIAQSQGLVLGLTTHGPTSETRIEFLVPQLDLSWKDDIVPPLPFSAEWTGILHVPEYGDYSLILEGSSSVRLYLDGYLVLNGPGNVKLPLAIGNHAIVVNDHVQDAIGVTRLSWKPPEGPPSVVWSKNLYANVESHGLLGTYFPPGFPEQSGAFQRIDPMVFSFNRVRPFQGEFRVTWEGNLRIDTGAAYNFKLDASGPANLSIDGDLVIENHDIGANSTSTLASRDGDVFLEAGLHPIRIDFEHKYGSPQIYLHWSSPYVNAGLVPWSSLVPASPKPINSPIILRQTTD